LQGRNSTETLWAELEKGWISRPIYHEDKPDRLYSLFFARQEPIDYLKPYPKVLIVDCTYNTNSAEMPLFEVIGIEATSKSLCVSFDFLSGETEEDYIWALEHGKKMLGDTLPGVILSDKAYSNRDAIGVVFPESKNLLCIWHTNDLLTRSANRTLKQ
jgi:hypothetical protein